MTRNEQVQEINLLIETFTNKAAALDEKARTSEGKWINVASNDMVLIGYDYDENHYNRLGVNGTGYSGNYSEAMLFETMDESYNMGNFYLISIVGGKKKTIHVRPEEAAPYFAAKAESFRDTARFLRERLEEIQNAE